MPDDEAWRHDLHTLLDRRGAQLWALAVRAADGGDDPDAAETTLVEALVKVFVPYRPTRPGDGAVRGSQTVVVVDDDADLDGLETAVTAVLASWARNRAGAGPAERGAPTGTDADEPDPSDGAPDDSDANRPAPSDVAAAVEPRVAAERRRRAGRRRVLGLAAAGAVAALVAGLVWGAGYGPGHGSPAPTATVAEDVADLAAMPAYPQWTPVGCTSELAVRGSGTGALPLHVRDSAPKIRPSDLWTGRLSIETNDSIRSHAVLAGPPQVVLVDVHGASVAAVGAGDVPKIDLSTRPTVQAAVRFTECGGPQQLRPGTYDLVAVQSYQDRSDGPYGPVLTATSPPVRLTVSRAAAPSADAEAGQPSWLAGTALACGIPAASLADLPGYFPQYLDDLATPADQPLGIVVLNAAGGPAPVTTGRRAAVAWVRDGRVVSVGPDVLADPVTRVVPVGGQITIRARLDPTDSCGPDDGRSPRRLPAGTYLAVPYAQVVTDRTVASGSAAERARSTLGWLVGVPRAVVVRPDGTVHDAPAQDG
ncbi:hypothetical protein GCM10025864_07720 [Luteimicrobium album]|uniref:FHA domain-containing protein n=1 Tax=Luteimicrobium album TaxID=1054550 RepID=A0ABQ6HYQ5_9MICO|nr:hypothetical protein [Luteimicrobium album]GMA23013.1 hypothetical protein GCM10025864_07720 [Luteimicrobium album]